MCEEYAMSDGDEEFLEEVGIESEVQGGVVEE